MSGASGKVPAAIHVTPEAAAAGRSPSSATATSSGSTRRTAGSRCWSTRTGRAAPAASDLSARCRRRPRVVRRFPRQRRPRRCGGGDLPCRLMPRLFSDIEALFTVCGRYPAARRSEEAASCRPALGSPSPSSSPSARPRRMRERRGVPPASRFIFGSRPAPALCRLRAPRPAMRPASGLPCAKRLRRYRLCAG